MSCPTLSESDISNLLSKADSLFTSVITEQPCDEACQERELMDKIATNLDNAKDDYTNAESKYNAAKKEYIVGHNGPSYYKNMESEEKKKKLEREIQENIDYFLVTMNASEKEVISLKNEIDNLNLIKKMSLNNINVSLRDIFGFDIAPSALKEGFETQTENLATLNRKIYYETNKNKQGNLINKILYIIYYLIFIVIIGLIYYNKIKI